MSHLKVKTNYNVEGSYGTVESHTVYADHNNSSDYVSFYDEDGTLLLTIPDTIDNNLLDAINRLYSPMLNGKLRSDIERMSIEDSNKIK